MLKAGQCNMGPCRLSRGIRASADAHLDGARWAYRHEPVKETDMALMKEKDTYCLSPGALITQVVIGIVSNIESHSMLSYDEV